MPDAAGVDALLASATAAGTKQGGSAAADATSGAGIMLEQEPEPEPEPEPPTFSPEAAEAATAAEERTRRMAALGSARCSRTEEPAAADEFNEQCAWLFRRFDADSDGALNRAEYKKFLMSIDVWGHTDAYTDVYWGWTWRRICEQAARQPTEGLDCHSFGRRYEGGPGRAAMLATDVARVRSASAAARARRPSETTLEVNCAKGHIMPLVPWSAGGHNPVGYQGGWLCDDCGRSCTDLGPDSSFATSRFFCATCKVAAHAPPTTT